MGLKTLMSHIDQLERFSSCGANGNKNENKHLWIKGASIILNQFESLIKKVDNNYNFTSKIIDIKEFENECSSNLGSIFKKNKTDKSNHGYHYLYSFILNELNINNTLNVLEFGLGTNNPNLVSTMGKKGRPGASLFAFREYLPKSNIYGADIDKSILFNEKRIKTCYVDQLDIKTFNNLNKFNIDKYDLIIDDGLHSIGSSFNTLLWALDNININGWIVVEDIALIENWNSINYILSKNDNFEIKIIRGSNSYLFCVKKNEMII